MTTPDSDIRRAKLEKSLVRLGEKYPDTAELMRKIVVECMEFDNAARACGMSIDVAQKQWRFARAWLLTELKHEGID